MNTREYLIAKGHSPEAIVCNDWDLLISEFDLEEMLEDYHQTKLKSLSQHLVSERDFKVGDFVWFEKVLNEIKCIEGSMIAIDEVNGLTARCVSKKQITLFR